jgi:hypothetical protein
MRISEYRKRKLAKKNAKHAKDAAEYKSACVTYRRHCSSSAAGGESKANDNNNPLVKNHTMDQ